LFLAEGRISEVGITTSKNLVAIADPFGSEHTLFVGEVILVTEVQGSASVYAIDTYKFDGAAFTALYTAGSVTTSGDAVDTYVRREVAINATVASTVEGFQFNITKNSGTGTLYGTFQVRYRLALAP
jgi:hypothetical protein